MFERPRPPSVFLFVSLQTTFLYSSLFFFLSFSWCVVLGVCVFILMRRSEMKTSEQATKSRHIYRDAWASSTRMQIAPISHRSDAPTHTHSHTMRTLTIHDRQTTQFETVFLWVFILVSTHRHDFIIIFSDLQSGIWRDRAGVIFTTQFQTTQQLWIWISFSILALPMCRMKWIWE